MLQVGCRILIAAAMLCGAALVNGAGLEYEWILEEALEKEHVPLFAPDVVGPREVRQALQAYDKGDYTQALYYLERLQNLHLPDGDHDFVLFATAESYRMLGLREQALANYHAILQHFPGSDKVAPSLYRAMGFAYDSRDTETADSLYTIYLRTQQGHALTTAVFYLMGKVYYRAGRFGEACGVLDRIPDKSSRHLQSQFLNALCRCELHEWEKALFQMEMVRTRSTDEQMVSEATVVIGDIYMVQRNYETAMDFYNAVKRTSPRLEYVTVKKVQALLALEELEDARDLARRFMKSNPSSDYYFEMASLLEMAYDLLGDRLNKMKISAEVFHELLNFRLSFEVMDELDRVSAMSHEWQELIDTYGEKYGVGDVGGESIEKLDVLERRLRKHLSDLGVKEWREEGALTTQDAERRYLNMMRDSVDAYGDSVRVAEEVLERARRLAQGDTAAADMLRRVAAGIDSARARRAYYEREYELVLSECFSDRIDLRKRMEDDRQAQFVDWTFRKYQEKKAQLVELNLRQSEREQDSSGVDSADAVKDQMKDAFAGSATTRLQKAIKVDRRRMSSLIESLVDMNPGGRYNPELLMRLAELYYDDGTDEFAEKLAAYEQKMAEGVPQEQLQFPDMDLGDARRVYRRIAAEHPQSNLADVALFYRSLALQKEGADSAANAVQEELIEKYPSSTYFVEANMNIGRYYFERPTIRGDSGYALAEQAFRRVLYYRDHPQFVQALYHLGWCYYMKDQYEEAIAVFRYLVEEVDLDFGKARMEDNQVANPLLREEAIDYIAIAFDERDDLQEAIRFLRMIGSFDYSSVVLKRMGELREEVSDDSTALEIYRFLEAEYPVTIAAPDASLAVIRLLESGGKPEEAMAERKSFFERFSRGGKWREAYMESDPKTAHRVDSLAISQGLFLGDAYYREASESRSEQDYERAARSYNELVKRYPKHPRASDARWNLALILETKLGQDKAAYTNYVAYSKLADADSTRREQAAMNAVAIAQRQIPMDSLADTKVVDLATAKLIEAVDNYRTLFPKGKNRATVLLAQASVFFNRRMFGNAATLYEEVTAMGGTSPEFFEALYHLAKCRFEQENWEAAAADFARVAAESPDQQQREESTRLMLQTQYLMARQLLAAQKYEQAGRALLAIEDQHPGSEYSDIVLFSAAEAFEKQEKWDDASKAYRRLVDSYPKSKYAPDALFNAATNYEKSDNFRRASELYEMLVDNYADSDKSKDGLFNLGLCYEKLGKPEKMAAAQERYSLLYPGEKDVEVMLMQSGEYYLKAGLHEKALAIFKTFVARFPRNDRSVEAVFNAGRVYEKMGDQENARSQYVAAQNLDRQFVAQGQSGNSFYAAEAAYALAQMQEKEFDEITLVLPAKVLKQRQARKVELLKEVAAAYQRVIEYQSERMFEAAYRIGGLYDKLVASWLEQEREKRDELKQAVFEKDLYALAASLLQKSFVPYGKTIELAEGFDSLGMEQKHWVSEARSRLTENYLQAGAYLIDSYSAMLSAAIPKNIREKLVYRYQYVKQLYETLEPLRAAARDYHLWAYREMGQQGLDETAVDKCLNTFAKLNYETGGAYHALADKILRSAKELPDNMDEIEREELVFNLEDIVFEVQDKAIFALEDAKKLAEQEKVAAGMWYDRILQSLAQLDPDRYGAAFFASVVIGTDDTWGLRTDSLENWQKPDGPVDGWVRAGLVRRARPGQFPVGRPSLVSHPQNPVSGFYLRRHVFLNGTPRGGAVYVSANAPYQVYVNGTLTLSDTVGERSLGQLDSAAGITSLLRGGDNTLACRVWERDSSRVGIAVVLSALVDTAAEYERSQKPLDLPGSPLKQDRERVAPAPQPSGETPATDTAAPSSTTPDSTGQQPTAGAAEPAPAVHMAPRDSLSSREARMAVDDAQKRHAAATKQVEAERLEIQRLKVLLNAVNVQIQSVKQHTKRLREELGAAGDAK